jgi:hypothetical protein
MSTLLDYVQRNPYENQVLTPKYSEVYSDLEYNIRMQVEEIIPAKMLGYFAKLPIVGSKKLKTASE